MTFFSSECRYLWGQSNGREKEGLSFDFPRFQGWILKGKIMTHISGLNEVERPWTRSCDLSDSRCRILSPYKCSGTDMMNIQSVEEYRSTSITRCVSNMAFLLLVIDGEGQQQPRLRTVMRGLALDLGQTRSVTAQGSTFGSMKWP